MKNQLWGIAFIFGNFFEEVQVHFDRIVSVQYVCLFKTILWLSFLDIGAAGLHNKTFQSSDFR